MVGAARSPDEASSGRRRTPRTREGIWASSDRRASSSCAGVSRAGAAAWRAAEAMAGEPRGGAWHAAAERRGAHRLVVQRRLVEGASERAARDGIDRWLVEPE